MAPAHATWSQNNRLTVKGRAVTLVVFGAVKRFLWHCEKNMPPEVNISIELLRQSDTVALERIRRLANAPGIFCLSKKITTIFQLMSCFVDLKLETLDAALATQTPSTVFASVYDSREGIRAPGLREGLGLNAITGGDIVRLDVGCRRVVVADGDPCSDVRFNIVRIHWIAGVPDVIMYRK